MNFKNNHGFTIIELLVTTVIIALLSTIGMLSYRWIIGHSRDTRRISDIEQIRTALELYRNDKGHYPALTCTGSCIQKVVDDLKVELVDGGFISSIPEDPEGTSLYMYIPTSFGTDNNPYGYCLSAMVENTDSADDQCYVGEKNFGYNYAKKNP
jgi:prepilin-type N-terminal cleavage/methylation domain-containing protein